MALPSVRRLEGLFAPYARAGETPVRVWGTDVGPPVDGLLAGRAFAHASPPRLLCLAGGPSVLVVVRQSAHEDGLDGFAVPWSLVSRVSRAPGFRRDVVTVEVDGRHAMRALVSGHLLLPGNRSAARALCALAGSCAGRRPEGAPAARAEPEVAAPDRDTRPIPSA
jgi:hypothetical protein